MVLRLERGARPTILTQAGARPARLTQSQLKQPMNGMHDVSHAFSPSANSALGLPHFWGHTVAQLAVWASSGVMPVYGPIWSATFIALFAPHPPHPMAPPVQPSMHAAATGWVQSIGTSGGMPSGSPELHRKVRQSASALRTVAERP